MTIAPSWRGAALAAAGIAVLAAAVEHFVGWRTLAAAWVAAGFLVVPALALLGVSYLVRAWRFQRYFGERLAGRFGAVLRVSVVHNLTNYVMPMRTGEATFPLMMKSEFGIPMVSATAALAWFRILDLCALAAAGIALAHLTALAGAGSLLQAAGLGGLVACLVLPWILFFAGRRLARGLPPLAEEAHPSFMHRVVGGLPLSAATVAIDFAATIAIWGFKLTGIAILVEAFTGAPLATAGIASLSGDLTGVLPLPVPAGLGTYEAGVVGVLALAGIDPRVGLAAAVNVHLMLIAFALLAGGMGLLVGGLPRREGPPP